jgi:anaerobic selenocysteine-containing dehydrogenase
MRRYGAYEIAKNIGPRHEEEVAEVELVDVAEDRFGRVFARGPAPDQPNVVPISSPDPDPEGRRPVGVRVDGKVLRGFPTPSGKLEFYSSTLGSWGWPEHALPGYIRSHIHPSNMDDGQMPLISTFRLPVQIHTRSANSKWLDEIAHTNPLWIHPIDATRLGVSTGDLVRVATEIGYYVVKAWVTEGIRPGVVACSHHMGRWKLQEQGQRQAMATVALDHSGTQWSMNRKKDIGPFTSSDPDTLRIWWTESGVHQNLTFPVQPDPISGQHCWHQAVRVRKAGPADRYGDIVVDTARAKEAYQRWLGLTRAADRISPDGTRRPYWLLRPLKPSREVYALP